MEKFSIVHGHNDGTWKSVAIVFWAELESTQILEDECC